MEPEIDRRCPDCGAAVRSQAAFCPQCGRVMKAAPESPAGVEAPSEKSFEASEASRDGRDADQSARPISMTSHTQRAAGDASLTPHASPAPPDSISRPAQVAREQMASGKPLAAEPAAQAARSRRGQRVAAVARDVVEERLAPRVERLRQASNVVWGEAQDDPNLRFILVALLLFIVALVVILLGTYIR